VSTPCPTARAAVQRSLDRLGLANRSAQLAGQLSGGWKQRLALAACLIHSPQLLLLDEPTAGVDPKARREFWDEIHQLAADGLTVLITTHYMDEAERCHRLAYLAYGNLLTQGTLGKSRPIRTDHLERQRSRPARARARLRGQPGIEQVVAFGNTLHVSGRDAAAPRSFASPPCATRAHDVAANPRRSGRRLHQPDGRSEGRAPSQLRMSTRRFTFHRCWAIVLKEFIQMKRDRVTFGMMVGIPLMQLISSASPSTPTRSTCRPRSALLTRGRSPARWSPR
jgi:energy-coupling factor transporter ATP-binding protein EcfA2